MNREVKYLLFALPLLLSLFSVSCDKTTDIKPEITLAKRNLDFGKATGSAILAIKSNLGWSAISSADWCTISPAFGSAGTHKLTLTVTENTTDYTREAIISITAGDLTETVAISQIAEKLIVEPETFNIDNKETDISVNIQALTTVKTTIKANWIKLKSETTNTKIFTVEANPITQERSGKIIFETATLKDSVVILQSGTNIFIPSDETGMSSNAATLAAKMKIGWNLGNALEVPGNETGWGNPKTTQELINAVKAAGFNAIRIPCAWDSYLENSSTYKIKESWLSRVKEVVDYCYNNDMYVIINIHWDGGWLEENPTYNKQEAVNQKQKALWEQIAVFFRDYDEHLLFAGTNEVHANYNKPSTENITVQQSFNQTFVDAVRSTGGKNTYRSLVVQSYNTNIDYAVDFLSVPVDPTSNRMMVEVHYYDPWDFAGDESSTIYFWGLPYKTYGQVSSWGQEGYADAQFAKMKTKFVDKGYPVILGEYGVIRRTSLTGNTLINHLNSRAYYIEYITTQAKINGIIPFYWDNGITGDNGFGLFNRSTCAITDDAALAAIIKGAAIN